MKNRIYSGILLLISTTASAQFAGLQSFGDQGKQLGEKPILLFPKDRSAYKPEEIGITQAPVLEGTGGAPTITCDNSALRKRIADLEKLVNLLQLKITSLQTKPQ